MTEVSGRRSFDNHTFEGKGEAFLEKRKINA
jgi:hypothetical protein